MIKPLETLQVQMQQSQNYSPHYIFSIMRDLHINTNGRQQYQQFTTQRGTFHTLIPSRVRLFPSFPPALLCHHVAKGSLCPGNFSLVCRCLRMNGVRYCLSAAGNQKPAETSSRSAGGEKWVMSLEVGPVRAFIQGDNNRARGYKTLGTPS